MQVGCSEGLREFLCALYTPICTNYGLHLPPCRSLCKKARKGCEEAMAELELSWPSKFDCTRFPEHHELMCVVTLNQSSFVDATTPSSAAATHTTAPSPPPFHPHHHSAFTPCSSNADCVFEIIGGQCTTDSQCSAVTPNAVCSNSACSCVSPLTSYLNLACIHASGIGDMCYNDAQCRALNTFSFCRLSVAEVVGVCVCDPDQFIDSRGQCVPRLGGRCHKGDCPRQLGAASCQRGRDAVLKCFCRKEAVQRLGVCITPA
ncbi:Frizzled-7-B [Chionoecetes opilio]|uniref:Frizzled-7-B n=1 Tax=Chionoecetes opilio TaxID=41210 RepID=A0A8J4YSU0_CHIOP|nr:Frizzled-7-B [Chionoecetes opilio]